MNKKKPTVEPAQWSIEAAVSRRITVTVEAQTEQEAIEKFDAMDWCDEQHGETTNFLRTGRPKRDA